MSTRDEIVSPRIEPQVAMHNERLARVERDVQTIRSVLGENATASDQETVSVQTQAALQTAMTSLRDDLIASLREQQTEFLSHQASADLIEKMDARLVDLTAVFRSRTKCSSYNAAEFSTFFPGVAFN